MNIYKETKYWLEILDNPKSHVHTPEFMEVKKRIIDMLIVLSHPDSQGTKFVVEDDQ